MSDPAFTSVLPVALYARLSVNPDGTRDSVPTQIKLGHKEAAQRWPGRPVIEFIDDGISAGDDTVYRAGYEDMLAHIRNGRVGDVLTRMQSRISRHELIWPAFKLVCLSAGITHLCTWTEGDLSMIDGESLGPDVMNLLNTHFRKIVKKNVNETLALRAIEGRPAGGKPYGYQLFKVDGRTWLQVNPEQMLIIDEMANRVERGHSLASVARWLNEQKVPTAKTAPAWTGETVKGALTNPTVTGLRVHKGAVVGEGEWEPILERDRWEAIRSLLSQPRKMKRSDGHTMTVTGVRRPSHTYLLTGGFCTCDLCLAEMTSGMVYAKSGLRIPSYVCKSSRGGCNRMSVKGPETEAHVQDLFLDYLGSKAFKRHLKAIDRDRPLRERLRADIAEKERQQAELGARLGDGLSMPAFVAADAKLSAGIAASRTEMESLAQTPVETDARAIRVAWDHLGLNEQQATLRAYRCSVVVSSAVLGRRFSTDRLAVSFGGQ